MRSEEDSLAELQSAGNGQELAYNHQLIELYGTPYPDDIGPGKTYPQGYVGPDLLHFMYTETVEMTFPGTWSYTEDNSITVEVYDVPKRYGAPSLFGKEYSNEFAWTEVDWPLPDPFQVVTNVVINIGESGFPERPSDWTGKRSSPGELQQAISDIIMVRARLRQAVNDAAGSRNDFVRSMTLLDANGKTGGQIAGKHRDLAVADQILEAAEAVNDTVQQIKDQTEEMIKGGLKTLKDVMPQNFVAGFSVGGDLTSVSRAALNKAGVLVDQTFGWEDIARQSILRAFNLSTSIANRWSELDYIAPRERIMGVREAVADLVAEVGDTHAHLWTINEQLRKLADAHGHYRALVAKGDRIQSERANFRKSSAGVVQGFRTRDAAFRIFRNEKLERYSSLFDLAAKYTYLAANAYDYETGLLHTDQGKQFVSRIINARALGVVENGQPQYAASNTGDPGLSSILAEMQADFDVLKGRLGFNNPDTYGTTVSMRSENYRILQGADGSELWRDVLESAKHKDIRMDADVKRFCMQIDNGDGLPVPGLILQFTTTISDGMNLFGKPLAAGDSYFSPSSFANKIHAIGIAFEGYTGISDPNSNSSGVDGAGGTSPGSPGGGFLDPQGLSATPYVYLLPVGLDSMRSPPLGDASVVRTWNVQDLAVPLPFNIGGSELNYKKLWQTPESLSEELFSIRKHQAFRAAASTEAFTDNPRMFPDNYTNTRLIGRSVWNSQWKLVIPGRSLLNDPDEGLDRFMQTVEDIEIHLNTYSYSGN
jgi:flagellar hook-basal body complex protein FliE